MAGVSLHDRQWSILLHIVSPKARCFVKAKWGPALCIVAVPLVFYIVMRRASDPVLPSGDHLKKASVSENMGAQA